LIPERLDDQRAVRLGGAAMSVLIIPCFIRSKWDRRCVERLLRSVREQSVPFDEVYVIDDASPADFEVDSGTVERIRLDKNGGPAHARNVGSDRAIAVGANHIFFTDHDCVLDREWNEHMTGFLERSEFGAVGGMTYALGSTLLDHYHDVNGTLNGKWLLPDRRELWYMPSLNFGMKADVARSFAFDERFPTAAGEDVDFCLRIRSRHRIGFCAKAKLWHDFGYRSTLTGLPRFIRLFMKYKSSSATLYDGHTVLLWDSSESIYEGNAHEPRL
jgi:GT2 family glycosyltransferase